MLRPVDDPLPSLCIPYYFWGVHERIINRTHHTTLNSLKASMVTPSADMIIAVGEKSTLARSLYRTRNQLLTEADGFSVNFYFFFILFYVLF